MIEDKSCYVNYSRYYDGTELSPRAVVGVLMAYSGGMSGQRPTYPASRRAGNAEDHASDHGVKRDA
jgi:hypothetical protein